MLCMPSGSVTDTPGAMLLAAGAVDWSTQRPATVSSLGSDSKPFQYQTSPCWPPVGEYISVLLAPNRDCHSAWVLISTQIVRDSAELT